MFGLNERPYSSRELKSFGVILIIKTLIFGILSDISVLLILAIINIYYI